jgi:DNA topoisomerase-3
VCNEGKVFETANAYVCERNVGKKCNFRMGKLILQRPIPREQAMKLIASGKTDLLPRFISKKNRPFAAYLKLGEKGKVEFEFEPREAKKPAAGGKGKRPAPAKASAAE